MNNLPLKATQLIVSFVVLMAATVMLVKWGYSGLWFYLPEVFLLAGFIVPLVWMSNNQLTRLQAERAWLMGQVAWMVPVSIKIFGYFSKSERSEDIGVALVLMVAVFGLQYGLVNSFFKLERS